ncbi:MAG TPA: nucleotidyltransferase domain-containing protein [Steroidobacteraceae bacterium]|jgi:hypothetical protein
MIREVESAQLQLAELCRRHNVRRLEIFGSATGSSFDSRRSDLDFVVEFGPFPAGGYSEHYFALLEDLKQLFNRPIDLLVGRAIRNPYLLESINRSRELLYAA